MQGRKEAMTINLNDFSKEELIDVLMTLCRRSVNWQRNREEAAVLLGCINEQSRCRYHYQRYVSFINKMEKCRAMMQKAEPARYILLRERFKEIEELAKHEYDAWLATAWPACQINLISGVKL